ncbi:MAG: CDP-diacylglycerol--serine O-phosphatidyltransferase [Bacteroidales bacterium]|nr:CDP-diacylglycerol--serine O-phosphatidyltransferase [Bacteroidales bacterium]
MKKHIPNIITCLNLVCGSCAIILTLWGYFYQAFLFIIAAAVFDFCDGAAARLLGSYSDIGKELDSLSDVISFGLAPSLMFFTWYYKINSDYPSVLAFVALLLAPFSALRLAKFNVDERQSTDFLGVPTPVIAMIVSSMVSYAHICHIREVDSLVTELLCSTWFIPVCSVLFSILLIAEIPMFSLKHKSLEYKSHPVEMTFFAIAVFLIPFAIIFSEVRGVIPVVSLYILLLFVVYLIVNCAKNVSSH